MPKPTRAEMAALVDELRNEAVFDPAKRAAAALIEALMQERAEPVAEIGYTNQSQLTQMAKTGYAQMWTASNPEQWDIPLYAAAPAKPAGELPPQIEQALEESMRWHNGHQYRFSNNEEARKVWADHYELLTDALRAIRERE